ncbi:MAG: DUF5107 domain-containing protein [Ruminococcaceae bacterium]|nr:DUF5107 domain-containing protein [Oscillospiraceae bacterium]
MLKIEKIMIPSANFGKENSLPPISERLDLDTNKSTLSEADEKELFIGYGEVESSFPYKYIDMYDRSLNDCTYDSVVLENEYLRATFMPSFGGKLWSLIDKETGRELLFKNSVIRPCNLAVRNAWMSGGVEWNCGFRGHFPYTCSLINTATTKLSDGTDVLRFYYFERIRACVVQMDFFLPEGEKFLYSRVRITNPNPRTVPMYWWSNIATEEKPGDRVVVPATKSYTAFDGKIMKIDIPLRSGIDISYPARSITANDYFWDIPKESRKYICQLDTEGYGLCQTSTARLLGRKLFIWGDSQGGHKWMNFLTKDSESGRYCEIQCGLAHTQYECLPMPAHTVWEWVEAYGALQADKDKVHSDWESAREEVENKLDGAIHEKKLEEILRNTQKMAESPAEKILFNLDGWGALELLRRKKVGDDMMCNHLDFGEITDEQRTWLELLESGSVGKHDPCDVPPSYIHQPEWIDMLKSAIADKDINNWYAYYLLGCSEIAVKNYDSARVNIEKSLSLCESPWANYAMAIIQRNCGEDETEFMLKAYQMRSSDVSFAKALFKTLFTHENSNKTIELFSTSSLEIQSDARCLLYYAYALARVGRIEEAEDIICPDGGYLVVPDIRECELTITQLWVFIQEQKGLTRETMGEIPRDLDFRMFAKREGWA